MESRRGNFLLKQKKKSFLESLLSSSWFAFHSGSRQGLLPGLGPKSGQFYSFLKLPSDCIYAITKISAKFCTHEERGLAVL